MKRKALFHSFFFTLAFLLYQYSLASIIASPDQIVRPLFILWLGLLILAFLAYWLTNNWEWTGILLSVFALGFFTSRAIFYAFGLISLIGILIWVLVSWLRRRRIQIEQINFLLIFISSLLVVIIAVFRIIWPLSFVPWSYYEKVVLSPKRELVAYPIIPDVRPDVYYVVLDGYGRADVLQELYGFENREFIKYLNERGFIVPENSHSNYPKTALSVASTLNMGYIQSITPGLQDSNYWWLMSPLINHSEVRAILEKAGYKTVAIASDWSITDNPTVDYYFKPFPIHLNDFEGFLLGSTPLGALSSVLRNVAYMPSMDAHRRLVAYNFETLSKIPDIQGPKFVFAHIVSPHPPFVFDGDGNPLDPEYPFGFGDANDFPGTPEEYRNGYIGQVEYVNRQLEQVIDTLIEKSVVSPIIILQADHGPGLLVDFRSAKNTCIKERYSVFAAYYMPGATPDSIPDDITPINIFRIIFNQYFGSDLPLLENSYYYYEETVYIYRPVDVSNRIGETCDATP